MNTLVSEKLQRNDNSAWAGIKAFLATIFAASPQAEPHYRTAREARELRRELDMLGGD